MKCNGFAHLFWEQVEGFDSHIFYQIFGEVAERFKAAVLKTVDGDEPSVGSNPTLTAIK